MSAELAASAAASSMCSTQAGSAAEQQVRVAAYHQQAQQRDRAAEAEGCFCKAMCAHARVAQHVMRVSMLLQVFVSGWMQLWYCHVRAGAGRQRGGVGSTLCDGGVPALYM
jgi:hypothetical protein